MDFKHTYLTLASRKCAHALKIAEGGCPFSWFTAGEAISEAFAYMQRAELDDEEFARAHAWVMATWDHLFMASMAASHLQYPYDRTRKE